MIIDVRPTPALRRHRAHIVGAVAAVCLIGASLVSVVQLASLSEPRPSDVTVSDRSHE